MTPFPPAGSTIASIESACCTVSGAPSYSCGEYYAFLGLTAARCAATRFGGRLTAIQLARSHSAAPLLLAIEPPGYSKLLEAQIADGTAALGRSPPCFREAPAISPMTRRCPQCVQEDIRRIGFAFARVLHQLPVMRHCVVHGIALEERCAKCGGPLRRVPRHPQLCLIERCSTCESRDGLSMDLAPSEGYTRLVELLQRCLAGDAAEAAPRTRVQIIESALNRLKSSERAAIRFQEHWGTGTFDEACARAAVQPDVMLSIVDKRALPCTFEAVVASLSFANSILDRRWMKPLPRTVDAKRFTASDDLTRRLLLRAEAFGLPSKVAVSLAQGYSLNELATKGDVHVRKFLHFLPNEEAQMVETRQKQRRFRIGLPKKSELAEYMKAQNDVKRQRRRALDLVKPGMTRTEFRRRAPGLYVWLFSNDPVWLNGLLPSPSRLRSTVDEKRAEVLRILKHDAPELLGLSQGASREKTIRMKKPRACFCRNHKNLSWWMLEHDRAWFDAVLPKSRVKGPSDTQGARRQLEAAVNSGIRSRNELRRSHGYLYSWLLSNDPAALELWYGKGNKSPLRDVGAARRRLAAHVRDGIQTRTALTQVDSTLYAWLRKNDPVLLERVLPRRNTTGS